MGIWKRAARPGHGWVGGVGLVTLVAAMVPGTGWGATAYAPLVHEFALLAYTNMSRAEANLTPLVWNDGLARAARWKSEDEIAHGCGTHDSCSGEDWTRRVGRYYPGWISLGENMNAAGSDPRQTHEGWMGSPGHRANILSSSYAEFGAGIAVGGASSGYDAHATEDFGRRASTPPIPTLPAAGVAPLREYSSTPRDLLVNYYDAGAPRSVRALVGSKCVTLPRISGSASNGSYGTTLKFADGCTPVVFEAISSDGSRHRWPEQGAIQVQAGSYSCSDFTSSAPTQDCGGGGGPLPTPAPAPTPAGGASAELAAVRATLKPEQGALSEVQVRIEAMVPALADFDPTSGPVAIQLSFGATGDWLQDLPQLCGTEPCLKANRSRTVYSGKYGADRRLSFVRKQNGRWAMRLVARHQSLSGIAPGTVQLSVTVDGHALAGSAAGEVGRQGFVAK